MCETICSSVHPRDTVYSLIRPYLDYYSVVWEELDSEFSLKRQKLQNRAARIITFSSYDSISAPYSKSLDGTGSLYAELKKCSRCTTIWHLRTYNKKVLKMGSTYNSRSFFSRFQLPLPKTKKRFGYMGEFRLEKKLLVNLRECKSQ